MKVSLEFEKQIASFRYAIKDAYEYGSRGVPAPCQYFKASAGNRKAIGVSCARCRAERMAVCDSNNYEVDCYTLMIIDFLKGFGVEVEDES